MVGLTPIAGLSSVPVSAPSGKVLAWGRIYVTDPDKPRTRSPKVGDCLRSSGEWQWPGVAYYPVPCADGFVVRAIEPFPDGEAG